MMCFFLYQYNISLPILSGVTILSSERDDETLCESAGCSDVIRRGFFYVPCSSIGLRFLYDDVVHRRPPFFWPV